MELFIIVFVVFVLSALLLSLSFIGGGRPLKGSCGGISNITGKECDICGAKAESSLTGGTGTNKHRPLAKECKIRA